MNDQFIISLARDRQNRILKEASLAQRLHQARAQSAPERKGLTFASWLAGVLGLRSRERTIG